MLGVATTTITVQRPRSDVYERGEETRNYTDVATVRATLSPSRQQGQEVDVDRSVGRYRLACDLTEIRNTDRIKDNSTSLVYDVISVMERTGLGIADHTVAELRRVTNA